jgi:hypothetical protein
MTPEFRGMSKGLRDDEQRLVPSGEGLPRDPARLRELMALD